MANTFLTPSVIAQQALATLYESTIMLPLVYTDLSQEFATAKIGDTVNVRKPAVFEAKLFNRGTGIEVQNATEESIPVVLNRIPDVSFTVTDEDMSLDIDDFDTQLLSPAIEAIAQHVDIAIIQALQAGVTQEAGTHADAATLGQTWDKPEVLIEAGRLLDTRSVPVTDRFAVAGVTTKARWLNTDLLKHAEKSGSTEALRQGSLGRELFGFEAYRTANIAQPNPAGAGDPTTEVSLAFHRTALAFASAPLEIPAGANQGQVAVANFRGLSMRVAYGWDIKYKQTTISVDMLYGTKVLDANRAVLLKGADAES